ncbi:MAG: hypothetical protein AAFP69_13285, partial [Planctomycetota bacterium]
MAKNLRATTVRLTADQIPPHRLSFPNPCPHRSVHLVAGWLLFLAFFLVQAMLPGVVPGQQAIYPATQKEIFDALDNPPSRFQILHQDCDARVRKRGFEATGSEDGRGGCERLELQASLGTHCVFGYRIAETPADPKVRVELKVRGSRSGIRLGVQLRFPYLLDPTTRRPLSQRIFLDTYQRGQTWETLSAQLTSLKIAAAQSSVRARYGANAAVH